MNTTIKKIKRIAFFILLLLCAGITSPMLSQVTIGSSLPPQSGSLLDLKQLDEPSGNQNSTKGMILPRVSLYDSYNLFPMFTGLEFNYESLKLSSTGMIVYNVSTSNGFKKGLYEWSGTQWYLMTTDPLNPVLADNGLSISPTNANTVELGGILNKNTPIKLLNNNLTFTLDAGNTGKIGIGNPNPQALLDVAGNAKVSSTMKVGTTASDTLTANGTVVLKTVTKAPAEVAQLAVDTLTGEVYKIISASGNMRPINYLTYQISTNGLAIKDFNTQIPTDDYTLVVVGSSFETNISKGLKMNPLEAPPSATFAPLSLYAYPDGIITNTWHLVADYPGATTASGQGGTWTIHCIAISNSIVKNIDPSTTKYQIDPGIFYGQTANPPEL